MSRLRSRLLLCGAGCLRREVLLGVSLLRGGRLDGVRLAWPISLGPLLTATAPFRKEGEGSTKLKFKAITLRRWPLLGALLSLVLLLLRLYRSYPSAEKGRSMQALHGHYRLPPQVIEAQISLFQQTMAAFLDETCQALVDKFASEREDGKLSKTDTFMDWLRREPRE